MSTYQLTSEEKEMLLMSEEDIEYGRVVSEEELDKLDEDTTFFYTHETNN